MLLRQVIELFDLLDTPAANGTTVTNLFKERGNVEVTVENVKGDEGDADCVTILIKGSEGKSVGGSAPTLGIIGRLGGLGARPEVTGFVSDGDGALAALAAGLKLTEMNTKGDMDAILSIDTTKGNRVINLNGFALSPTIKEGYILEVSNDLMDVMTRVTGKLPAIFPVAQQDITPYGNDLHHLNSILQPATSTNAPVVGVAITTEQPVAGCATGACHFEDVESAARFAVMATASFLSMIRKNTII